MATSMVPVNTALVIPGLVLGCNLRDPGSDPHFALKSYWVTLIQSHSQT